MWDVLPRTTNYTQETKTCRHSSYKKQNITENKLVSGKIQTLTLYMASGQLTGHENWT